MSSIQNLDPDSYLELFKITDRKYLVGIYQDGITVYKQQIRALNIFYLVYKKLNFKPERDVICVVGGGIAGVTIASAALKAGIGVLLIEKTQHLLHMQRGCETRVLHPNIYEWPEERSYFPYAKLPVASWRYGTASNVTRQILKEYDHLKEEIQLHGRRLQFDEYVNVEGFNICDSTRSNRKPLQVTVKVPNERNPLNHYVDAVFFAVGYGIEYGVGATRHTPSYWRNDAFGQSILHKAVNVFFISGVGDGGLIDMFRLKIMDFDYEMIIAVMKSDFQYSSLITDLLYIKDCILAGQTPDTKPLPPDFLFQEFETIQNTYYSHVVDKLRKSRLIRNNRIILNSTQPFPLALDYQRISLLNAFIAYILYKADEFEYVKGFVEYDAATGQYKVDGAPIISGAEVIIRQGTNTAQALADISFLDTELARIKELQAKQKATSQRNETAQMWSYEDMHRLFVNIRRNKQVEYLTPDTTSLCSSFASVLYHFLFSAQPIGAGSEKVPFRICIHRLVCSEPGKYQFQQVTSYFGTENVKGDGGLGRVLPVATGIVGYSFATGQPLLVQRNHEKNFKQLMLEFNVQEDSRSFKSGQSYLTIPVLSTIDKKKFTNLVIFIESDDASFFTALDRMGTLINKQIIESIVAIGKGFVNSIEHLVKQKNIHMEDYFFTPLELKNITLHDNSCTIDLKDELTSLSKDDYELTFSDFYSFDVTYDNGVKARDKYIDK